MITGITGEIRLGHGERMSLHLDLVKFQSESRSENPLPSPIIIITRPKPAYGRQGLAGSWGQDTDEMSTFLVFLTSHFAPAALSSDLTNLGPLMTIKIHLKS